MTIRSGTKFDRLIALRCVGRDERRTLCISDAMPARRHCRHQCAEGGHARVVRLVRDASTGGARCSGRRARGATPQTSAFCMERAAMTKAKSPRDEIARNNFRAATVQ